MPRLRWLRLAFLIECRTRSVDWNGCSNSECPYGLCDSPEKLEDLAIEENRDGIDRSWLYCAAPYRRRAATGRRGCDWHRRLECRLCGAKGEAAQCRSCVWELSGPHRGSGYFGGSQYDAELSSFSGEHGGDRGRETYYFR